MNKKCLIFFTIGIGDSLMVTPVIEKIRKMPGYEFDALTISPQVTDIMKNSGDFREVYIINFLKDPLMNALSSLMSLRKNNYDMSILVFPSNHYKYHLVHSFIGAKKDSA
jgi:ADP-heptose:LPS heptosyltransferase